jgi:uncharacterized protein YejL (UPF0352 family)
MSVAAAKCEPPAVGKSLAVEQRDKRVWQIADEIVAVMRKHKNSGADHSEVQVAGRIAEDLLRLGISDDAQ